MITETPEKIESPFTRAVTVERQTTLQIADKFSIKLELNKPFYLKTPEGDISSTGQREILNYLASNLVPFPDETFEWVWQNKRGTLPKRLQSYLYKTHKVKLSSDQVSELGNMARRHSDDSKQFILDFDRKIQWSAGDFGDGCSCYWGSNSAAKGMLRDNGALAIRAWKRCDIESDSREYGNLRGYARAWVSPLGNDKLIVFNGYGETSLTFARLLALKFNCTYKKISLTNNGCQGGLLYINSDGIVVGQWSSIEAIKKYDLGWYEPEPEHYYCPNCDTEIESEDDAISAYGRSGDEVECCSHCAWYCEVCESNFSYRLNRRNCQWVCDTCVANEEKEAE